MAAIKMFPVTSSRLVCAGQLFSGLSDPLGPFFYPIPATQAAGRDLALRLGVSRVPTLPHCAAALAEYGSVRLSPHQLAACLRLLSFAANRMLEAGVAGDADPGALGLPVLAADRTLRPASELVVADWVPPHAFPGDSLVRRLDPSRVTHPQLPDSDAAVLGVRRLSSAHPEATRAEVDRCLALGPARPLDGSLLASLAAAVALACTGRSWLEREAMLGRLEQLGSQGSVRESPARIQVAVLGERVPDVDAAVVADAVTGTVVVAATADADPSRILHACLAWLGVPALGPAAPVGSSSASSAASGSSEAVAAALAARLRDARCGQPGAPVCGPGAAAADLPGPAPKHAFEAGEVCAISRSKVSSEPSDLVFARVVGFDRATLSARVLVSPGAPATTVPAARLLVFPEVAEPAGEGGPGSLLPGAPGPSGAGAVTPAREQEADPALFAEVLKDLCERARVPITLDAAKLASRLSKATGMLADAQRNLAASEAEASKFKDMVTCQICAFRQVDAYLACGHTLCTACTHTAVFFFVIFLVLILFFLILFLTFFLLLL